jgi:hypothetical protein
MREQLARYRTVGGGAETIESDRRRLVIRVAAEVPDDVVTRLIAVEQECCPFFRLEWTSDERRFELAVPSVEYEPALDALRHALSLA